MAPVLPMSVSRIKSVAMNKSAPSPEGAFSTAWTFVKRSNADQMLVVQPSITRPPVSARMVSSVIQKTCSVAVSPRIVVLPTPTAAQKKFVS